MHSGKHINGFLNINFEADVNMKQGQPCESILRHSAACVRLQSSESWNWPLTLTWCDRKTRQYIFMAWTMFGNCSPSCMIYCSVSLGDSGKTRLFSFCNLFCQWHSHKCASARKESGDDRSDRYDSQNVTKDSCYMLCISAIMLGTAAKPCRAVCCPSKNRDCSSCSRWSRNGIVMLIL